MQSWVNLRNMMRSYRSYLVLILVPYLFLIFIFHTQLQLYDAGLGARELELDGWSSDFSARAYHVRDLRLQNGSTIDDVQHGPLEPNAARGIQRPLWPGSRGSDMHNNPKGQKQSKDNHNFYRKDIYKGYIQRPGLNIPHGNESYSVHLFKELHNFEQDLDGLGDQDVRRGVFATPEHCRVNQRTSGNPFVSIKFQSILASYIYTAFYDDRTPGPAYVRIIALLKKTDKPVIYCHFENDNSTVSMAIATYYEMCENHAKDFGGWVLSCHVPSHLTKPPCKVTVSLHSDYNHNPQGNLKVPVFLLRSPQVKKLDFGICVPPLFGYIPSTTLIEFVELTRILGAEHLVFYAHEVPREIHKVLRYYNSIGVATVIPWDLPVQDKSIWYHGQLLAINDCLYRNMHRFRYLSFNDIDEFIVPHKYANWTEMVQHILDESLSNPARHAGYSFQSAFFDPLLDTSSRVLYDLESDLRTKSFSKVRTKVMVEAERIFELGIHHISRPVLDIYKPVYVEPEMAFLHHYRKCITDFDPRMNCQIFARDESVSRYIPTLRHNVHQTLWILKEAEKHSKSDPYRVQTL